MSVSLSTSSYTTIMITPNQEKLNTYAKHNDDDDDEDDDDNDRPFYH